MYSKEWCRVITLLNNAHSTSAVSIRLKSVKNIEKITKSMKMVSAAKFQLAERELKPARSYGEGAQGVHHLGCVHAPIE